MDNLENLDSAREALAVRLFDQGVHYKILFVRCGDSDPGSSLAPSLRNLGHHVFELDLEKHRDFSQQAATGLDEATGFASIFLEPLWLDRFCAKVKPQIVILCAAGVRLTPEHAQQLKQKGMVLVGMSLNDPDGFAAAHPHASVFDFHTTNARLALDMYQRAGVHNTLYLPPGIERGWLTQTDAPARYRNITRASFRRVASSHLYEQRWMALLEVMFNCSPDTTPWLAEARIQSIRQTLAESLPRCKQVIVSGFYGASNLGDELILRAIEAGLRASDAAVQITVAAEDPVAVERDHGLQAFSRRNLEQALHQVRTASAILIGGGGLWHDYTFAKGGGLTAIFKEPQLSMASFAPLPMMARFFNTPCHVVGMGVGPITTPDALRMLRFVADLADTIHVRDAPSMTLLNKAGVAQGKAFMAPDLVYALVLPVVQPAPAALQALIQLREDGYTVVGLNLRPWAACDESALFARLAQALRLATGAAKLAIVTIPMQKSDNVTLSKFVQAWTGEVRHIELTAPLSLEALLGAISACDVLLSMRLHTALVAHRLRKPVVGLAYDPKVTNHFEQIGRPGFALALDTPAADLAATISAALHEQGQLPIEIHLKLLTLEAKARAALNVAAQRIAALPCADKVFEASKA
jgi:polysaccharide pyruvyl transferase CsaB